MDIIKLKEQIVKNELSNFYIFTGEEIGIMNIYLQQMSNKLKLPITRAESVASIYSQCTARSMFGNTTGFYVIRNDNDFNKQEKVWATIEKDIMKNVIVLLYDKIDSRLKFGKFFKDKIVPFEKLQPNVLKSYIKKAITLSDKNIDKLAELCNGSYDLCMLEIDKIRQYAKVRWESRDFKERDGGIANINDSFTELLNCGVIYQPEESDVWKFIEAVCNRKNKLSFDIERILRNNGSSSINLLGTLYSSMKTIMLIQSCEGNKVCEITGLDNKQVYFNKKYVGKYDLGELVLAVKLIAQTIDDIKNGKIDDIYATRYVLSQIM